MIPGRIKAIISFNFNLKESDIPINHLPNFGNELLNLKMKT